MTIGNTTVTTTIRTNCPNQIQIRNRIEGRNRREQPSKTRNKGGREKGKNWYIPRGTQSPNIGTHKEVEERDLLCIVAPYLIRYYTHAVSMDRHQ